MNDTVLKIALAGLLHDVGKFAQGSLEVSRQYLTDNADQYQPFRDNRHTHVHSVYTAAFIEQMADRLPHELNSGGWGEGDSFLNLASGHHKPETPMQWIIAMADRISSGLDRATFEEGEKIAFQDFKKTRMLPVLEALGHERHGKYKAASDYEYRYPLAPLSALSMFAEKQDIKSKSHADKEYCKLFDDFLVKLRHLFHADSNIDLWSQHFDSLYMTYTSMVPAARVNDVVHDVSLYDHSKTTAAFASALYLYHYDQGSLNEKAVQDKTSENFLLVTGDFYGIQDFIFSAGGELNKNRSKILRGRSFAVSLFSELAADMICRAIGLSHLSVILNAAGKFTIIAPHTTETIDKIKQVEKKINNWLYDINYGQSSLGIIYTPAASADFINGNFTSLWNEKHQPAMERKKLTKVDLDTYGGMVDGYLDQFDNKLQKPLCPLCGKRPAHSQAAVGELVSCKICRDHRMLGTFLVKGERLAVFIGDTGLDRNKSLLEPIFGEYQLSFSNAVDINPLKLFNLQVQSDGLLPEGATMRLINGYVPVYTEEDKLDDRLQEDDAQPIKQGDPVTFNHLAAKAKEFRDNGKQQGVEALGILKADVDNLGILMAAGFPDNLFTISRLANISRQLNNFFTIYLPFFLQANEKYKNVYTVFAGGDDLFLIGPWRIMAELTLELRGRFTQYVCDNDQITFSAGISLQKTHVPVDRLASAAEDALAQAKNAAGKNSVSMFGETVNWNDFAVLHEHKNTMEHWFDDKLVGKAMLYRFNQLIELARRENSLNHGNATLADMECLKWRSKFKYTVARNIDQNIKGEARQAAIEQVSEMAKWLSEYGGAVCIPLWQLLYEQR
ncbi:MAG: type III-A CRISPR-associated protein Cas10/Csm1 [Desulfobulbaceae bacterium]|nr:type III-A CRISPR-associated protein Cas10/Csm1 [Desulfobulbaceae bacterium]